MTEVKRCEQCGREGTRGFRTIPGVPEMGVPPITECSARTTCRRRCYRNIPVQVRAENRNREW